MINVKFNKSAYVEIYGIDAVAENNENSLNLAFGNGQMTRCVIKDEQTLQKVFDLIWHEVDAGSRTVDISEYVENSYAP